jgi:hypothetical protein
MHWRGCTAGRTRCYSGVCAGSHTLADGLHAPQIFTKMLAGALRSGGRHHALLRSVWHGVRAALLGGQVRPALSSMVHAGVCGFSVMPSQQVPAGLPAMLARMHGTRSAVTSRPSPHDSSWLCPSCTLVCRFRRIHSVLHCLVSPGVKTAHLLPPTSPFTSPFADLGPLPLPLSPSPSPVRISPHQVDPAHVEVVPEGGALLGQVQVGPEVVPEGGALLGQVQVGPEVVPEGGALLGQVQVSGVGVGRMHGCSGLWLCVA